jgi:hypothetical protein
MTIPDTVSSCPNVKEVWLQKFGMTVLQNYGVIKSIISVIKL